MKIQKTKGLKPNDTVGLTAPAGPVCHEKLNKAVAALEEFGFYVKVGETCDMKYRGYLAGTPERRAAELNAMFSDQETAAIFCLRGGYGSQQILPYLDSQLIKNNPKLLVGYSDITALHLYLQQRCGLPSIHGPMPASDLIDAHPNTEAGLLRLLFDGSEACAVMNPPGEKLECMVSGKASGILTGGNLSLICALMGTPYEMDTKGKILFLEEINEEPYKLDRMLTQLALGGKFSDAEGVVLGSWSGCQSDSKMDIKKLFNEILTPFRKPILYNLRAGHCSPMVSLPFGAFVEIDADRSVLIIKEGIIQ